MKEKKTVTWTFLVHEVVVLTGFTKYMLDYLAREDIFAPSSTEKSSRGVRRRYTYEDVVLLRALNAICAGKGKIRHLKDALVRFRATFGPMRPGQRLDKQLYVQGDELCVFTSAEGGRQLRSGQMTFSFVVDLSAVSQALADCVEFEPRTGEFRLTNEAARKAEEERQKTWSTVKTRRELTA
jgi:hypothetical protein